MANVDQDDGDINNPTVVNVPLFIAESGRQCVISLALLPSFIARAPGRLGIVLRQAAAAQGGGAGGGGGGGGGGGQAGQGQGATVVLQRDAVADGAQFPPRRTGSRIVVPGPGRREGPIGILICILLLCSLSQSLLMGYYSWYRRWTREAPGRPGPPAATDPATTSTTTAVTTETGTPSPAATGSALPVIDAIQTAGTGLRDALLGNPESLLVDIYGLGALGMDWVARGCNGCLEPAEQQSAELRDYRRRQRHADDGDEDEDEDEDEDVLEDASRALFARMWLQQVPGGRETLLGRLATAVWDFCHDEGLSGREVAARVARPRGMDLGRPGPRDRLRLDGFVFTDPLDTMTLRGAARSVPCRALSPVATDILKGHNNLLRLYPNMSAYLATFEKLPGLRQQGGVAGALGRLERVIGTHDDDDDTDDDDTLADELLGFLGPPLEGEAREEWEAATRERLARVVAATTGQQPAVTMDPEDPAAWPALALAPCERGELLCALSTARHGVHALCRAVDSFVQQDVAASFLAPARAHVDNAWLTEPVWALAASLAFLSSAPLTALDHPVRIANSRSLLATMEDIVALPWARDCAAAVAAIAATEAAIERVGRQLQDAKDRGWRCPDDSGTGDSACRLPPRSEIVKAALLTRVGLQDTEWDLAPF